MRISEPIGFLPTVPNAFLAATYNTASITPISSGMGITIVPTWTGNILILGTARAQNGTSGDGVMVQLYRSTIGIPAEGSAPNGADVSLKSATITENTNIGAFDVDLTYKDTGLTPGATYYYYVTW